jgi:hypothetical protein
VVPSTVVNINVSWIMVQDYDMTVWERTNVGSSFPRRIDHFVINELGVVSISVGARMRPQV